MPHIGWEIDGEQFTINEAFTVCDLDMVFAGFPKAALVQMIDQDRKPEILSPSSATACPRQRILKSQYDYYLDPAKQWGATVGSAIHNHFEDDTEWAEKHLSVELPNGVTLAGTPDHYNPTQKRLVDYKTIASFQKFDPVTRKRGPRKLPDPKHIVQLQLYIYLLRSYEQDVEEGFIWYVRQDREATRRLCPVQPWPNEHIENLALELSEPIRTWKETGELPEAYTPDMEESQMCRWCEVADTCAALVLQEEDAA
jgi:CRISPR/Cas system-associated exonuclease Cas4 (RecB family)